MVPMAGELVADAEGAEGGAGDLGLELGDEVGVDEVEDGLERHPERQGGPEAEHLRADPPGEDAARARGHRSREPALRRSKHVSGMERRSRARRVPSMKVVVTGS